MMSETVLKVGDLVELVGGWAEMMFEIETPIEDALKKQLLSTKWPLKVAAIWRWSPEQVHLESVTNLVNVGRLRKVNDWEGHLLTEKNIAAATLSHDIKLPCLKEDKTLSSSSQKKQTFSPLLSGDLGCNPWNRR